ncbi:helical backbone metal receptor [Rhizoclosmatium globosum]|uniref:Diphthine--ammonia ligase n=1 Tax=Rhizoclosmatium globosum TaxID=329046 RepID=A0A1Y2BSK3_9FUNG|nr:helical backbone metal receptor [Rhizoclosmatium globosum]|eukprot:ORY37105.1 helical backbone metal receptor [Rhizoclosmatium globosum]
MASVATRLPMRIISLLPSATELIAGLFSFTQPVAQPTSVPSGITRTGRLVQFVGRSHECDYPPAFTSSLPALTTQRTTAFTSSADTHRQVQSVFETENSLYTVDEKQMAELRPDVIVAQDTCKVCSIDLETLEMSCRIDGKSSAVSEGSTRIVSVNSKTLMDALEHSIAYLGKELDMEYEAGLLIAQNKTRLETLKKQITPLAKPQRVVLVEWMDPLFLGSGWTAELVKLAGGELIGKSGRHPDSVMLDLAKGLDTADIDLVIVCLCGLDSPTSVKELKESRLIQQESWYRLAAVQQNRVFVVDGNSMFHRPTPRLLDALDWLIHTLRKTPVPSKDFPVVQCDTRIYKPTPVSVVAPAIKPSPPQLDPEIEECHRLACAQKQAFYTDPKSGYSVMTEYYLKQRQLCCGNACRHCPYGHSRVKDPARRKNHLKTTVFLGSPPNKKKGDLDGLRGRNEVIVKDGVVVVFWSGGRHSLMALERVLETCGEGVRVVLMTTIDPSTNTVPMHNVKNQDIAAQALSLNLPVVLVPVSPDTGNNGYGSAVKGALELVEANLKANVVKVVFGDAEEPEIKAWRESTFAGIGRDLWFPNWGIGEAELRSRMWRLCEEIDAKVCATGAADPQGAFHFFLEEKREWWDEKANGWMLSQERMDTTAFPGGKGCFTKVLFVDMWDI